VVLVERKPSIGGHMSMLDETFPTLDCSQCILTPRMVEIMQSDKIKLHTYSEVEQVDGYVGNFTVKIRNRARSVDMTKCTGCGDCWNNCLSRNKIEEPVRKSVREQTLPAVVEAVDAIVAKYRDPAGMVIGALQDIQERFNYLRQDAMAYLSEAAGIPLSRLYGVARFYHAFSLTPRGKNIIRVCLGTACHLKGAGGILEALERILKVKAGGTTEDGIFSLEEVRCLGCCGLAPVITINDEVYSSVTQAKLPGILERYREEAEETEAAGAVLEGAAHG